MTKAKSNALEALRALIAERQQYEQWISTLESKREGTPQHVFERVHGDYSTRLKRVVTDIKGHAEELQLSISTLSSRLVEVAREEDTRRDSLDEAKLRAEVGEYEPQQWEQLRTEAEAGLERIAADRAGLDSQLGELRSIQKLSEVGSVGEVAAVAEAAITPVESNDAQAVNAATPSTRGSVIEEIAEQANSAPADQPSSAPVIPSDNAATPTATIADVSQPQASAVPQSIPVAADTAVAASNERVRSPSPASQPIQPAGAQRQRTGKTPPFGSQAARPKPPEPRVDQSKTLKCPECGTPNYPTEWYCERCGGELATM